MFPESEPSHTFHPFLVTATNDRTLHLWADEECVAVARIQHRIHSLATDGKTLFTGDESGAVQAWDTVQPKDKQKYDVVFAPSER